MRWPWQAAPLAQEKPEPTTAALQEQIDIFRRQLKRFEGELDEAMQEHRALRARMSKLLEAREKGAQPPAGATITTPAGVTGQGPVPDRWTELRDVRKARQVG